jgi:3-phytase
MTSEGQLVSIDGGKQPTPEEYEVYGSCVYRSKTTGNQYLFVNDQTGQYLQFEPTSASNGTLSTALVRSFTGGSGGQVEGCVTDEAAGFIFLGEEGLGLWRYDAEPNGSNEGTLIASAGDGTLFADVEGITFVPGKTADKGLILVSCQGVSAYSIFRRAPPHAHVGLFTIGRSTDGAIDAVSNTDGITAVGTRLSDVFPHELLVTHDDANELAAGGTAEMASFKLVSLADVLGRLGVLDEVDSAWNPRA